MPIEERALNLRVVAPMELHELVELYSHVHPASDPRPRAAADESVWAQVLAQPGLTVFVADHGGRLVSTCTLIIVPNLTRGARPYAFLENVVTHPDCRRRGFGSAVVRHAMSQAWQRNCYKVLLQTGSRQEETLKFYESVGLERGITTGFAARAPTA
jgi:GNAT superfamily N-acetyltransferase